MACKQQGLVLIEQKGGESSPVSLRIYFVAPQQGVPGDAVPWPEREVSSLPSLFPRLPPQAA